MLAKNAQLGYLWGEKQIICAVVEIVVFCFSADLGLCHILFEITNKEVQSGVIYFFIIFCEFVLFNIF
jgi:hypothetical protein